MSLMRKVLTHFDCADLSEADLKNLESLCDGPKIKSASMAAMRTTIRGAIREGRVDLDTVAKAMRVVKDPEPEVTADEILADVISPILEVEPEDVQDWSAPQTSKRRRRNREK